MHLCSLCVRSFFSRTRSMKIVCMFHPYKYRIFCYQICAFEYRWICGLVFNSWSFVVLHTHSFFCHHFIEIATCYENIYNITLAQIAEWSLNCMNAMRTHKRTTASVRGSTIHIICLIWIMACTHIAYTASYSLYIHSIFLWHFNRSYWEFSSLDWKEEAFVSWCMTQSYNHLLFELNWKYIYIAHLT